MKKKNNISFIIFVILLLILLTLAKRANASVINIDSVKVELEKQGVKHPDIVLRQAILETGWFSCTKCSLKYNNIFGFWYKKKYLVFTSWKESVSYYKRWQDRHYKGGDYYNFLKDRGYATDPLYITKLKNIKI